MLASDVGGTFTDLVLVDRESGRSWSTKVPSRNRRQEESVRDGVKEVLAQVTAAVLRGDVEGVHQVSDLERVPMHHGTTVATNALLERRGARVVFLTNEGFEDLLVIRRQDRPDLYDARVVRPEPLVPEEARIGIGLRRGPNAEDWSEREGDLAAMLEAVEGRIKELAPEAVAVGLLHADLFPEDEALVVEWLRTQDPERVVVASHSVWPEMREVERFETTVLNAYLAPVVAPYLARLRSSLEGALKTSGGLEALQVLDSAGTLRVVEDAARLPASLLLSGPAGGVAAAAGLVGALGLGDVVTFDVGGTSTDLSFLPEGRPSLSTESRVAGFACRFPSVEIHTLGAGGGSVVWRDPGGHVQVGPHSQGAYPGPACYGRGGEEPTLTDALLLAGRIPAGLVFGGRTRPERPAAFRVFERLAARLGRPLEETFLGAIRLAVEATAGGVHVVTTRRGHDARDGSLVAFGGAGPMIACELATAMEMRRVVVPWDAGTFSARGMVSAPLVARQAIGLSLRVEAQAGADPVLEAAWDGAAAGLPPGVAVGRAAVRYVGQSHELEVDVARETDAHTLRDAFEAEHERRFGHRHKGRAIEVVRLVVEHVVAHPDPGWAVDPAVAAHPAPQGLAEETAVWCMQDGAAVERTARVLWRGDLAPGQALQGPLVVPDATAITYVPQDWTLRVDVTTRALILTREGA